jgi:hypothetical protein
MHLRKVVPVAAAMFLAAGCSKGSGGLSVSAKGSGGTAVARSLDLGNGIVVDRVRVVVAEIKLEAAETLSPMDMPKVAVRKDGDSGGDDGDGEGENEGGEVKVGPFLIDLTGDQLGGPLNRVFDGEVPPGTYREVRLRICPVTADQAGADLGLAAMAGLGDSVAIDGTSGTGSTPFELGLSFCAKIDREATIVVAADGTSTNLTLTVDPGKWFAGPNGSTLDPTKDADRSTIQANILSSFDVFKDDDDDGEDDDHGGGGGDEGHG